MAEYTVFYTDKNERSTAISNAESQGHVMLRDEFDLGPNGENQLIFEDSPVITPPPTPTPREVEINDLQDKIKLRNITLSELVRYIELRDRIE